MPEAIFLRSDGLFEPTEHALGPWGPGALHGGAAAGLIASALERCEPGSDLPLARLSFEFVRPVPLAPLSLQAQVVRPGRRVQALEAELRHQDTVVCRASALRVVPVPDDLPLPAEADRRLPGPDQGRSVVFSLDPDQHASFAASAMEMRWLQGSAGEPGPGTVWMRLRHPLVSGQQTSPVARLTAAADFGNGVSAVLPWTEFLFINADLIVSLHRRPSGEWIGLDAHTRLTAGGCGLAESVLHDEQGPVGRALQSLVVQRR